MIGHILGKDIPSLCQNPILDTVALSPSEASSPFFAKLLIQTIIAPIALYKENGPRRKVVLSFYNNLYFMPILGLDNVKQKIKTKTRCRPCSAIAITKKQRWCRFLIFFGPGGEWGLACRRSSPPLRRTGSQLGSRHSTRLERSRTFEKWRPVCPRYRSCRYLGSARHKGNIEIEGLW